MSFSTDVDLSIDSLSKKNKCTKMTETKHFHSHVAKKCKHTHFVQNPLILLDIGPVSLLSTK